MQNQKRKEGEKFKLDLTNYGRKSTTVLDYLLSGYLAFKCSRNFSLGFFDKDTIQVCARCNLDIINIGKVMEKLNGGGDCKKAATQIHIDNNLEQLQKRIKIEQLVDILNESIEGELQDIQVKGEQRVLKK